MDRILSLLQRSILDFIIGSVQERGYPPTVREVVRRFKLPGESSGAYHLKVLEEKGFCKRNGSSRGLTLAENPFRLPILGRVGAGSGVIAQEDIEGHLGFKDFSAQADFLLRVKGDSMADAGIVEGDLVQVRRQQDAQDGDIVAALVGEEGVVKRLRKRPAPRLESANKRYAPITADFQVIGKVVGLVRRYAP